MNRAPTYKEIPIGSTFTRNQRLTGSWSIFRPIVERDKCTKCGLCVLFCPDASIKMTDKGSEVNYDYCKGCGICANECPVNAITMVREELEE